MKRRWKIFWIICAVASVVGVSCCIAALGMGVTLEMIDNRLPEKVGVLSFHSDADAYLDDNGENIICDIDKKGIYECINNLDVDVFAGQIEIVESAEAKNVEVKTEGINKKLGLKCYVDNDTLCITSKKKLYHINGAGVGTITITVPETMRFHEVDFDIEAGTLNIEEIRADKLDVDMGAGEAKIDSFEADELNLDCATGSMNGFGRISQKLDADCGIGNVDLILEGKETDYNYNIDCGVGDVSCGDQDFSGLGTEKKINHHASKEINIDCGVGKVELSFTSSL